MSAARLAQIAAEYRAGTISRRTFIERLVSVMGGAALAGSYLETSAWARRLALPQEAGSESGTRNGAPVSVGIESASVSIPAAGATLLGYLSRPQPAPVAAPFPGLLLIHEDHGLNEQLRGVARRLAAEGFFVLAVDHLSRQGGVAAFTSPDAVVAALENVSDEDVVQDLEAATSYLRSHPLVAPSRIGVLGFRWGGERAFLYATVNPTLKAAVVFCGGPPPEDALSALQTPVLGHYAEHDILVTSTVAATQAAMQQLGKSYDARIYPAAEPAFFHDTSPHYDETAAQDSWSRTRDFLRKHLALESF